jgi:hypothetical protein
MEINMKNKFKTFMFGWAVVLFFLAIAIIPMIIGGCLANSEPTHYYKIQRLNINGEVQQIYYSKGYPWGTDGYVTFTDYPSNKYIKMQTPYIAEDIGTNKPIQ